MIKFSLRTAQSGTFHTGTPDYVDVDNTFSVPADRISFATAAAIATQPSGAWATADLTGILIRKSTDNYKVWRASWDATNEFLLKETEELSVGTISNSDPVTVYGVLTPRMMDEMWREQFILVSGTSYTVQLADHGKIIRCTSSSATTLTIADTLPVGFHASWIREGTGTASVARAGADTLNGGTTAIGLTGQWRRGWFYQISEGAWGVNYT